MEHLAEMLGGLRDERRPALDRLLFPLEHTRELLQLAQAMHEKSMSRACATYKIWQLVNKVLPACVGKDCDIDLSHATRVFINITGDYKKPEVGKKGVLEVYPFPKDQIYRLIELGDERHSGPLHAFDYWSFIGQQIPAVAENPDGNWRICTNADFVGVMLMADKDDE
jgi:hypothetical protein